MISRRTVTALLGVAAVMLLLAVGVATVVAGRLAPAVRSRLIAVLQEQLQSPVRVGAVQTRYRGGLRVSIDGLEARTVLRGVPGDPMHPMLRVNHVELRMSLLQALLGRVSIADATARGIQVELPPTGTGPATSGHTPTTAVHLARLTLEDAHVTFATGDPTRAGLRFDIPHAELSGLDRGIPFLFQAVVDTGAPIGSFATSGTMGPWNLPDPRATPLEGTFSFTSRSITSVRGLLGTPSMRAHYHGTLGNLETSGKTEDPAFALDVSANPVALRTTFDMQIDAVHGLVHLSALDAHFLHTHVQMNGTVTKNPQLEGYVLDLALQVPDGRIEDGFTLAARTRPALLRGGLTMQGDLKMPAGPASISQKLLLRNGSFHLQTARFGNAAVQRQVDSMSERAKGQPENATAELAAPSSATASGAVTLAAGTLHLSGVRLTAPGAQLALAGTYALGGAAFSLAGTMHTDAKASHLNTGLKSLLTRPFDALFAHGQPGATFPLRITGEGNTPRFRITLPGGAKITANH